MDDKQTSVDLMGEHLLQMLTQQVENGKIDNSDAIHSEWMVDGQDPEDGVYQFLFINDLTQV